MIFYLNSPMIPADQYIAAPTIRLNHGYPSSVFFVFLGAFAISIVFRHRQRHTVPCLSSMELQRHRIRIESDIHFYDKSNYGTDFRYPLLTFHLLHIHSPMFATLMPSTIRVNGTQRYLL